MNRWLKSIVALFLGVIILLTGTSLTLAKMVCLKSGYTSITFNQPDECCKHEHADAPVTIDEKCCDVSSMHLEALQYLISSSQNIQKSFVAIEVAPLSIFDYTRFDNSVSNQVRRFSIPIESSLPPIRILTGTFLI